MMSCIFWGAVSWNAFELPCDTTTPRSCGLNHGDNKSRPGPLHVVSPAITTIKRKGKLQCPGEWPENLWYRQSKHRAGGQSFH